MEQALIQLSQNAAVNHPRHVVDLKKGAALGFMSSTYLEGNLLGYKAVSVFSKNSNKGLNPHQGFVVLLDSETGQIKCLLDGSTITALRTAAVSSAATEKLSRADSSTLALIGAGRQALEHALAIIEIRPIRKIIIYNRTRSRADHLIQLLSLRMKSAMEFSISSSPAQAVGLADIVVTCTNGPKPILTGADFKPGTHINAIGACRPGCREIDLKPTDGIKIFLDSREACALESSEITHAQNQAEIGSCFSGEIPGRSSDQEVTLFKSVGLGLQDLFAANYFYKESIIRGGGQFIDFGGSDESYFK